MAGDDWFADSKRRYFEAVGNVGHPMFGLAPSHQCHRSVGGWGSRGVTLRHVSEHFRVDVTTCPTAMDEPRSLNMAITRFLIAHTQDLEEISFPLQINIDRWSATLRVDGALVDFDVIGSQDTWEAHAVLADRAITIDARWTEPSDLSLSIASLYDYEKQFRNE